MENEEIIERILLKLDGWVLDTTVKEEELTTLDYNKCITEHEILDWYEVANDNIISYVQSTDTSYIDIIDTVSILWTAGLIWQKYNQQVANNLDETNPNPWGYGDKLIIQAKAMLKPYKNYSFHAY